MMITQLLYAFAACLLIGMGIRAIIINHQIIQRIIAMNIIGAGVFMLFITIAYRGLDRAPDPIPHALVLTGIVVAISATALALALVRRLDSGDDHE